ncbi:S46 family peptidase [Caulobacter sp. SLTY]|nr:S46 family peptidase [Caulobacter sp. SLTY]
MNKASMTRYALLAGVAAATLCAAAAASTPALADEGMWTFDNLPIEKIKADYGVTLDSKWLDDVRLSSVRLAGCSASFVSKDGLILTNNHCVLGCSSALSSEKVDYVKGGFRANLREEELKCPGQTAEVLLSITDVTDQIRKAGEGKAGEDFVKARDAAASAAEKAVCGDEANVRCQTISFYRGGQYKVYKFQRYTDVRLVFAPEQAIAFFGGDPDNFNFPRYDLDAAFLRAYQDGKPVQTKNFLKWNANAPKEGEVTFVVGNPGSTERLLTVSQLETQRDLTIPIRQLQSSEMRGRLIEYSKSGAEAKRTAGDALFGLENGYKVFYGRQLTLNDRAFMDAKRGQEAELRAKVKADPALSAKIGDPWADIEKAQVAVADNFLAYRQLETEAGGGSRLYGWARTLVRSAQERAKPAAERSADYSDAALARIERGLAAETPVIAPIEQMRLEHWMLKTREYLTVDHPGVKAILGKESPEALSARLVSDSKLGDPAVRKALWDGGLEALQASDDPMIKFVLATEGQGRALKKTWDAEVTAPVESAAERIAQARFAVYGESVYPDATFSLRLSYGKVAGWTHRGTTVPSMTRIGGTYERATGQEPFALPQSWIDKQSALNPQTVFNFTTTNDIIGGNSGSPVINAKGQVIGTAFDGNIHSLGGAYGYDGSINRTVVVSTAAITESLTKVYGMNSLVKELTGK